ncbi:MAG: glycosyltransferase, partial [Desulfovibrio sp.]|nr:glycosyltransferase [Desulfovibrio sp.]
MCKISFCIPCYRSENTIGSVIAEIEALMSRFPNLSYEIVCAVDGSPDQVLEVLVELAKSKSYLKIIDFTMNFGQASARLATLRYASGDYLICLDDDGQCPVERSFELIKPLEEGFDLAIAKYPKKK